MPARIVILGQLIPRCSGKTSQQYKKWKKYYKSYKEKHHEKYVRYFKEYNARPENKRRRFLQRLAVKKSFPWLGHWRAARRRCHDKKLAEGKVYIKRKIQFLLSLEDAKFLWNRDGAQKMSLPILHRIDNNGHYHIENCKFISCSEHSKLHHREKK